jgi:hypothetical protein
MWVDPDSGKTEEQQFQSAWDGFEPPLQAEIQKMADARGCDVLAVKAVKGARPAIFSTDPTMADPRTTKAPHPQMRGSVAH